jgi:hypothetical protein
MAEVAAPGAKTWKVSGELEQSSLVHPPALAEIERPATATTHLNLPEGIPARVIVSE